jgi:hypothetical protein
MEYPIYTHEHLKHIIEHHIYYTNSHLYNMKMLNYIIEHHKYSLRPWIFAFLPFKFCPKKTTHKDQRLPYQATGPTRFCHPYYMLAEKKQILMYRHGDVVPSPSQVLTDYWRGRSKDQSDFYRSKGIFVISHIVLVLCPDPEVKLFLDGGSIVRRHHMNTQT